MFTSIPPKVIRKPQGKKNVIYPNAKLGFLKPMFQGAMIPKGIYLHYTAGDSAKSSITFLVKKQLGYHLMIDRDGSVTQMYDLVSTVYYAGSAVWNDLSPNRFFISIAICSYGLLTPMEKDKDSFENVYGQQVDSAIYRRGNYWEPATHEQEDELIRLCTWLCKEFSISPDNICGHDECCVPKGRKIDPGGVLGFSMENFRGMISSFLSDEKLSI